MCVQNLILGIRSNLLIIFCFLLDAIFFGNMLQRRLHVKGCPSVTSEQAKSLTNCQLFIFTLTLFLMKIRYCRTISFPCRLWVGGWVQPRVAWDMLPCRCVCNKNSFTLLFLNCVELYFCLQRIIVNFFSLQMWRILHIFTSNNARTLKGMKGVPRRLTHTCPVFTCSDRHLPLHWRWVGLS